MFTPSRQLIPMTPALPSGAARRKGPLDPLRYGSRPLAGCGMSSTSAAALGLSIIPFLQQTADFCRNGAYLWILISREELKIQGISDGREDREDGGVFELDFHLS